MKLLFVVDGRSPIALNWIRYFVEQEHEVHIASMYPCQPDMELASLTIIPVAFSGAVQAGAGQGGGGAGVKGRILRKIATPNLRTWLRQRFVPGSPYPSCFSIQNAKKERPIHMAAFRVGGAADRRKCASVSLSKGCSRPAGGHGT